MTTLSGGKGYGSVKRFRIAIGDKSYNVEVGDPQEMPVTVIVDGETFSVDMQPVEEANVPPAVPNQAPVTGTETGDGPAQVTAPMPGKILDITADSDDPRARLYGIKSAKDRGIKMPSPMDEVKGLGMAIKREAAVKIIDELLLLLPEKPEPEKKENGEGEKPEKKEGPDGKKKEEKKK